MAEIGLSYGVCAPIQTESDSGITYGTGFVFGKMMTANITRNRNSARVDADNTLSESDNSMIDGTISVGIDALRGESREKMLGYVKGSEGEYDITADPSPYVGMGYICNMMIDGNVSYEAHWYHKVQFAVSSEDHTTKGQSTQFTTPTLDGNIMGAIVDDSGKIKFERTKNFETESAAKAWLNGLANISA